MESLVFFGIFIIILLSFALINFLKMKKKLKQKENAQAIFSRDGNNSITIVSAFDSSSQLLDYLKAMVENKHENNVIVESYEAKENGMTGNKMQFLKFDNNFGRIDILSNPDNLNVAPQTANYSDIDKVFLRFRSYSETRGSGKSSRTYYYNQYWVTLRFKENINHPEAIIYNKTTYVSQDNGILETESRAVGELLAKILKINLVRIDGSEVEYTKLDESILAKLNDFVMTNYQFKKPPFSVEEIESGYCINQLQYYNIPKIVLGIIAIVLSDAILIFCLFYFKLINVHFNLYYSLGLIFAILSFCGLSIFYWVKASKYKFPELKSIIKLYKEKIEINLKTKNRQVISSEEFNTSEIEEIIVRYETSRGYTVKLVADKFSARVASYYDEKKSNYLRDEILDILKKMS